ncbi:phospholipase A2 inhibitor beta [Ahaetulla prasina]|uniref:phospholipase A2 inhibitor beta n=1 Tax=Ahaetulla prasina TaxID=499056 RepID=UPI002649E2B9|nr:phospholipase A2 inhibitor beta [Ahaetulla prasina]
MKSSVPALLIVCLVMSFNSFTQQVLYCPPDPAPENITEFVCNSPSLHEFPTGFPVRTKMISVEFTQVSSLSVEALQGLPSLQELHLSNNRLKTLPSGLFRNLPELHTLDLSTNLLEDLPPEIFTNASSLTHLSISENWLAELRPSWFETLKELRILSLDHNQLKEVPISCFDKLEKLTFLDLSSNRLHRLSPDMFSGLENLERLILESNPIRCIAPRSFHWRPKLSVISLKNCSLTDIIIGVFQPLDHLVSLDLSGNELTMLDPPVAIPSANLSLDLTGNPWACDCRMDNLLTWVKENKIHLYSKREIVCAFPKSFKGKEATSLHRSQICPC